MSKFTAKRNGNPLVYPLNKSGTKTTTNINEAWMWNRKCDVTNWLRGKPYDGVAEVYLGLVSTPIAPPTPAPVAPPKKIVNYIALCLDASASMDGSTQLTIDAANKLIESLVSESKKLGTELKLTIFTFNHNIKVLARDVSNFVINSSNYYCHGNTALTDCLIEAIETLGRNIENANEDVAYSVYIITDGQENQSRHNIRNDYTPLFNKYNQLDNWTFAAQCPYGNKKEFMRLYGFESDNVQEWDGVNTSAAIGTTTQGFTDYLVGRTTGIKKSLAFYKTDLSGVSDKDLSKLQNVSHQFSVVDVPKESRIKTVVESKTKQPYIPSEGKAFYLLQKPETIQSFKQVLVRDKATDKLFSGTEARKLIGLPDNKDAKVEPFNHSHFEVFVQSTSVNRILPRGTKLAIKK